jgi:hypothetical protein
MGLFKETLELIEFNRKQEFNCIPFGLPSVEKYLPGIIKSSSYLIGAYSGDGKTTLTDSIFLYNAFEFYKKQSTKMNIYFLYWSFEIEKRIKIAKGICRKLYLDYNIRIGVNDLLSISKNRISDEIFELVKKTSDYFEELEDHLTIISSPLNPTGVNKAVWDFASKRGKIEYDIVDDGFGRNRQVFKSYTPNIENEYVIIITDHVSLSINEQGFSDKQNIDKYTEYTNYWRNNFGYIPVVIQQFSADTLSVERFKVGKTEPDLNSFGDSKTSVRNFNYVLALYNPMKFEIYEHRGYNISILRDYYRYLFILKSRDGAANVGKAILFLGDVGYIKELPKAEDFKKNPNWYSDFKNKYYIN